MAEDVPAAVDAVEDKIEQVEEAPPSPARDEQLEALRTELASLKERLTKVENTPIAPAPKPEPEPEKPAAPPAAEEKPAKRVARGAVKWFGERAYE